MDKTTNWLVRGASAIVIIFGISYFAQSYIQRFKDYQSLDEDEKALLRCENFPKLSYFDLVEKVKNNEIKEYFYDWETGIIQVITTKGKKYIIQEDDYYNQEISNLLKKFPWKDLDEFEEGGKYSDYDWNSNSTWSPYTSMLCK